MIRQISENELDQLLDMSEIAFAIHYTEDVREQRKRQVIPEQVWGYYMEDQLCARVEIIPFEIVIQGDVYKMGGIASVASYPELRRNGMVGKLMDHSLKVMKQNGQTISLLNPFSFSFYRKYGWEWFSDLVSHTVERAHFPRIGEVEGKVRRGSVQDLTILKQIYHSYAYRFNGMLLRSDEWWNSSVFRRKLGQMAIYWNGAGEPRGYILYKIVNKRFRIQEWIALDAESRKGLWQYVANHDSIVDGAEFSGPINDPFAIWLSEPGSVKRELYPWFMFRIVDFAQFAQSYSFQPMKPGETVILKLSDEHATWNAGLWQLDGKENGKIRIKKLDSSMEYTLASQHTSVCECDIQTLSAMMIGFKRPHSLYELGRLSGDLEAIQLLEEIIPRQVPYSLDMF